MKTCSKCRVQKPLFDFSPRSNAPDGLQYWCKACKNFYSKSQVIRKLEEQRRQREIAEEIESWSPQTLILGRDLKVTHCPPR